VHVDYYPCHITALPVAINFQCNASRHASEII
ncbi:fumarate hydratase, partial [Salmonella enterica subsp. enterica serovar Kentucky]|nr:fumarate hydratase [Salmonella enterica subsp. enterica serovar Kentucky]EEK0740264.1 fumarate hydratase [Salmonella enterica subsp. enterica serovar Typhimurium]